MFKFITNLFKSRDFGAKRSKIMGTFTKALVDAQNLDIEIQMSIEDLDNQRTAISKKIETQANIKGQNLRFIENLTKLVE